MAIPVSHLWQQRISDLSDLRTLASSALLLADMPPFLRRLHMHRCGVPRHLYKFRGAVVNSEAKDRLRCMLLGNQLYGATPESLNDPFDCSAAYKVAEQGASLRNAVAQFFIDEGADEELARAFALDEALEDAELLSRSLEEGHRLLLRQIGVCSLAADARSTLLWSHYGQQHEGVAIQYRPYLDPLAFQVCEVKYTDALPVVRDYFNRTSRDLLTPLLTKATPWHYEREWRVIRLGEPNRAFVIRPEALTAVVLGMRISPLDRDYVVSLVGERHKIFSTRTVVYQAAPADGSNVLRIRKIA